MISEHQKQDILTRCDLRQVMQDSGLSLKKSGTTYKCRCPFHNEKDASLVLWESSNRWKCFGCGKGGNAIDFVMEMKGHTYTEAVKYLAKGVGITLEEHTPTAKQEQEQKERHQQGMVHERAALYYQQQLKQNPRALSYALSRFDMPTIEAWGIGYAPDEYNGLYLHLRGEQITFELLERCDLFRQDKSGGCRDLFRDRLMFPIMSLTGRVVAFSGRRLDDAKDTPKYINNSENILYSKGSTVFGLNMAWRGIRARDMALVVEGNADVVKLHQLGVCHAVACCGTSITDEHIALIGRASRNICLMLDGDNAGQQATIRNGKRFVEAGYNTYVLAIPKDGNGQKQDPDSFFSSGEQFVQFDKDNRQPFLTMLARQRLGQVDSPTAKANAVKEIVSLFASRGEAECDSQIQTLAEVMPPASLWRKTLKEVRQQSREKKQDQTSPRRTMTQEQESMIRDFGFYVENNCYHFYAVKGDSFYKGSNFVLEPLFHIESTINAKRLYRVRNCFGAERVLELAQKDLISIAAFRLRCESMGNFLFEGGDLGLNKIKAYLYQNTKTCKEIVQLGWQKQGFFAWANGITTEQGFKPISELGIVEHKGQHYYLPAMSSFYMEEDSLFQFERKFVNRPGKISLFEYCERMRDVYGENAIVGIGFYLATLFRDVIISVYRFFPIMNIFGPKGTGKSEMAVSLLKLFGDLPVGVNMTNSTIPGMADHVARTRNALCHIDEYKNSVDYEKIEFLKGLWDGTGRTRMNMDKDKKKETTAVDAGIMLTGQEMATADNALFSRVVFLSVNKTSFTQEEKQRFQQLKDIEKQGLTHITDSLFRLRGVFLSGYVEQFDRVMSDLRPLVEKSRVEDRILKNWAVVLAALKIGMENLTLPFSYGQCLELFAGMVTRQNGDVVAGNEVSDFWNVYQELFSGGLIEKDFDFTIKCLAELKTTTGTVEREMKVLFVNPNRIFALYAQAKKNANEKKLPKDTLQYYLKNSPEFIGLQQRRFRRNLKNLQERESAKYLPGDGTVALEYERPYAWCFDYGALSQSAGLNLETVYVWEPKEAPATDTEEGKEAEREEGIQTELPY